MFDNTPYSFTVPPDPPHIVDPNGRRLGSLIGPYDEGESLSITCMSSKGNHYIHNRYSISSHHVRLSIFADWI